MSGGRTLAETAEASARLSGRKPFSWRFVTPMLLGSALNPVNSSLIATALVPIAAAVHVSIGRTAVLVSALYLATAIGQPTAGKLSEVFGPRRVFLGGILAVLAGGVVGGLGDDLMTLIVARVLIGIGTSTAYPSAMLLVRRRATRAGLEAPPGGVLGGLVIAGMVTPAIGLPVGGILVQGLGWQATFFTNVPLALITLVMAAIWIPRDQRAVQSRTAREVAARIDLAGIVGFGGTLAALLVFLMGLPHPDWIALAVGVVAGAALVGWELRVSRPFFDVRLLARNLALTRTYLRFAIISLCVYTVLYGVTQWLQAGRGLSAVDTGLILLPMSAVGGVIARPVSQRNLLRAPLVVAAVACVAGSVGVLLLRMSTPVVWIAIVTLLFGITLGTGVSANQTALYTQVPAEQIGTASGMFRTWGYIGSIASSAIIAISFHASVSDHGLHVIALAMVAVSAIVLLITVADRRLMALARAGQDRGTSQPVDEQANRIPDDRRKEHATMTPLTIDPRNAALLVMDFQNGIVGSAPEPDALLERVKGAIADVRAGGGTIGYVRVAFTEDDWAAVPETNMAFSRLAEARGMHHEDAATQIDERIAPQDGDIVVRKTRIGAMSTTDLHEQLTGRGIDTLVLTGISTSGVVMSTLVDALDRDYRVIVLSDGVADRRADIHEVLLNTVFPSRAHVIDSATLRGLLQPA